MSPGSGGGRNFLRRCVSVCKGQIHYSSGCCMEEGVSLRVVNGTEETLPLAAHPD